MDGLDLDRKDTIVSHVHSSLTFSASQYHVSGLYSIRPLGPDLVWRTPVVNNERLDTLNNDSLSCLSPRTPTLRYELGHGVGPTIPSTFAPFLLSRTVCSVRRPCRISHHHNKRNIPALHLVPHLAIFTSLLVKLLLAIWKLPIM